MDGWIDPLIDGLIAVYDIAPSFQRSLSLILTPFPRHAVTESEGVRVHLPPKNKYRTHFPWSFRCFFPVARRMQLACSKHLS